MVRFHPQWLRARELVRDGQIGHAARRAGLLLVQQRRPRQRPQPGRHRRRRRSTTSAATRIVAGRFFFGGRARAAPSRWSIAIRCSAPTGPPAPSSTSVTGGSSTSPCRRRSRRTSASSSAARRAASRSRSPSTPRRARPRASSSTTARSLDGSGIKTEVMPALRSVPAAGRGLLARRARRDRTPVRHRRRDREHAHHRRPVSLGEEREVRGDLTGLRLTLHNAEPIRATSEETAVAKPPQGARVGPDDGGLAPRRPAEDRSLVAVRTGKLDTHRGPPGRVLVLRYPGVETESLLCAAPAAKPGPMSPGRRPTDRAFTRSQARSLVGAARGSSARATSASSGRSKTAASRARASGRGRAIPRSRSVMCE